MSIHAQPHKLGGKTVKLKDGTDFTVEDWADRVLGVSWMAANGNPAALVYAIRVAMKKLPIDNNVLYGKIGWFGHLIHVSEIAEE